MAIPKPDARHKVLEAAVAIVAREGAAHLTIDAVAAQAGLSKGGVLYHFPSKRALLDGMLERLLDDSETRSAYHRQQTGSRLAAWIETEREQSAQERATALALLANAAEDPSLLDPARQMIAETFGEVSRESRDPQRSQILLLAAEGLRFLHMLDLLPMNAEEREQLHEQLLSMARETVV